MKKIGVDPYGVTSMAPKTRQVNILLTGRQCKVANILKQEMLSLGADAAVARGSVSCSIEGTDVLLMGTLKQLLALPERLKKQPSASGQLARELEILLANIEAQTSCFQDGEGESHWEDKTLIMGVLNVTPDSFSDGNLYFDTQKAIERALQMEEEGADIIDNGAESSRPGAMPLGVQEEMGRLMPVLEGLRGKLAVALSVDTTKARVAGAAIAAGVEIVNDISALHNDEEMAKVVSETGAGLVLMHMRVPKTCRPVILPKGPDWRNYRLSQKSYEKHVPGIEKERIAIDRE